MADLSKIMTEVQSQVNMKRVNEDVERFFLYNGKLRDVTKRAIQREFKKPETILELSNRIIPINITQKIINKLAGVYIEPPTRKPIDENPRDQDLIDMYSRSWALNQKAKWSNRMFKLHKHFMYEPFLDFEGIPRLRVLPSHTYTVLSDDPVQPERPTIFIKHIDLANPDKRKRRFQVWTDETFLIVDGEGTVVSNEMLALNNPDGINPFGRVPFVYTAENDDGNLIPISDDDLISMQVAITLLLTDLAFASKYQLWSVIAISGAEGTQQITFNPNSIIELPAGASVSVIKPEIDSDKAIRMIETLISMLLTTKNLSVNEISTDLKAGSNSASGISKLLDRAESTEDRLDQQEFFRNAEKKLFDLMAFHMLPVWTQTKQINPEFAGSFSDNFELSTTFAEPKPFVGAKDSVDLEITKLNNGLTTRRNALRNVHPDLTTSEVDDLELDIDKEKIEIAKFMERNLREEDEETDA